jgi:L-ribulose-5-phosphate 3-epimerase
LTTISFMTANYVAREVGYAMHGWGHGDRTTNEAFASLDTYGEKLNELFGDIASLGFTAVDVWGAHLSPDWATDEHVELAVDALRRHRLTATTYATWVGPSNIERSCELTLALGASIIGGGFSGEPEALAPTLAKHGVRLGIENHPEKTPQEILAKIERGNGTMGATVDTGWWATQGYDPAQAIRELGEHVRYVHLKDVRRVGEPHESCRWGEGVVDIEACVRALQEIGYDGGVAIEHVPDTWDPTEEIEAMRAELVGWLA